MPEIQPTVRPNPTASPSAFAILVSALLGGLAGGVAWCFVSLPLPWFATYGIVAIGVALAAFSRWQGYRGVAAIVCTVFAILIAFVYAQYLFGAVRIADSLGMPLREALFKAGFDLTSSVAWANLRIDDWAALAVAIVTGSVVAAIGSRRPH
ncbi:MAG: hypothetical protein J0I77_08825 [Rudaea sp.]|uniref:hypothetical protein n=1 Tax=unclassified Rudaea TaxID=2627037 RepID=UPI0010F43BE4|nr:MULTISPECIES: hypothetical protein [unclassified Rudaea]MBN8885809.1 hypothetical protein [Rudaea sp.]MBR0347479.1 hypothetical protein [Rudaea sp.]